MFNMAKQKKWNEVVWNKIILVQFSKKFRIKLFDIQVVKVFDLEQTLIYYVQFGKNIGIKLFEIKWPKFAFYASMINVSARKQISESH